MSTKFEHTVSRDGASATVRVKENSTKANEEEFEICTAATKGRVVIGDFNDAQAIVEALTDTLEKFRQYRQVILGEHSDLALSRIMKKRV